MLNCQVENRKDVKLQWSYNDKEDNRNVRRTMNSKNPVNANGTTMRDQIANKQPDENISD